jgi:hypothetical protein
MLKLLALLALGVSCCLAEKLSVSEEINHAEFFGLTEVLEKLDRDDQKVIFKALLKPFTKGFEESKTDDFTHDTGILCIDYGVECARKYNSSTAKDATDEHKDIADALVDFVKQS